jgi:hypothetical protein
MGNYWLVRELVQAAAIGYVLFALLAIGLALWLPKNWAGKVVAVIAAVLLVTLPLVKPSQELHRQAVLAEAYREQFAKVQALFNERCKTAGEKVFQTVDGVESVLLLNIRSSGRRDDPLWPDAALPHEATDEDYVRMFLYWEHDSGGGARGFLNSYAAKARSRGYQFVDVKNADGSVVRYRLKKRDDGDKTELVTEAVSGQASRYAVGFVNRIDPEDRLYWVAGTTINVIDAKTNQLMATRESYSFEPGLGSKAGARAPWGFAVTCPSFSGWDGARTRFFVDQVLRPKQEES